MILLCGYLILARFFHILWIFDLDLVDLEKGYARVFVGREGATAG